LSQRRFLKWSLKVVCTCEEPTERAAGESGSVGIAVTRVGEEENAMAMVTDPVCGMRIDTEDVAAIAEHQDKRYYFCSQICHDAFVADPDAYAA
jgi:YHS domain-containing protein